MQAWWAEENSLIKKIQYVYIQVHLKKKIREKLFFILFYFLKWNFHIYFRFITCKVRHFKSFVVLILMISHESQKPVSQSIRIFTMINEKKDMQTRKVQVLSNILIYSLSTWSGLL